MLWNTIDDFERVLTTAELAELLLMPAEALHRASHRCKAKGSPQPYSGVSGRSYTFHLGQFCEWLRSNQDVWAMWRPASKEQALDLLDRQAQHRRTESGEIRWSQPDMVDEPAERGRDEVWDAVVAVCGYSSTMTASERGMLNRLVKDYRTKGATPAEIEVRAGRLRAAWGDSALTAASLLRHWDKFGVEQRDAKAVRDQVASRKARQLADREAQQRARQRAEAQVGKILTPEEKRRIAERVGLGVMSNAKGGG